MKKSFCLILCLLLLVCLCGCGGDDNNTQSGVDLSYYALCGQIPEVEYSLGADPDVIAKELKAKLDKENANHTEDLDDSHGHDENQFYFEVVEGEKNVLLDNGPIRYYYNKANKSNGVSYIVNFDTAYGLSLGTVISEVKNAFPNVEFLEEPVSQHNAFFADYVLDGTVLTATFGETAISFVFQENALFATAIRNNNWSN